MILKFGEGLKNAFGIESSYEVSIFNISRTRNYFQSLLEDESDMLKLCSYKK